MNDPAPLAASLVGEIHRKVEAECSAIAAAAAGEAAQVLSGAREQAMRELRSEVEAAERARSMALARDALAAAWPLLAPALARRWADPAGRGEWIAAQLALARGRLRASDWTIAHPPGLAAAEVPAAGTLRGDDLLGAGLVVSADGATIASTPEALLADRPAVEAALLAALAPR